MKKERFVLKAIEDLLNGPENIDEAHRRGNRIRIRNTRPEDFRRKQTNIFPLFIGVFEEIGRNSMKPSLIFWYPLSLKY